MRIKGVIDGVSRQHAGQLWPTARLFRRCPGQESPVGAGAGLRCDAGARKSPDPRRERAHGLVTSSWRSANCLVVDVLQAAELADSMSNSSCGWGRTAGHSSVLS